MLPSRLLALLALMGGALLSRTAFAADPDPALLFDRGTADMDAGRLDTACPAIEQSYKLDPRPGTLFTLAECETKRGRFGAAAARYDDYLALYPTLSADKKAKQGDREKTARAQRAALSPRIAELTLVLPPGAPRGTQVTCDGIAIAPGAFGVPFPVDAGEHVATAQAPGGPVTSARITLGRGERKSVALEVKEVASGGSSSPAAPTPVAPAGAGPNKALIITGGAVTAAGVIVGAVFTGLWVSKGSSASSLAGMVPEGHGCPVGGTGATGTCADLVSALSSRATFGSVAIGTFAAAGAVGIATLIYGLASPRGPWSGLVIAPVATAHGGSLLLQGSF
jgi:hypothetical protein